MDRDSATATQHNPQLTVAVNDTMRVQTRGSGTEWRGWWGRSRATCGCHGGWRMRQERRGGGSGGGWGSNAEAEMVLCLISYRTLLGEASKICEVVTKLLHEVLVPVVTGLVHSSNYRTS